MGGVVYCLTNQAMPEYVKIGMASNLEQRLQTLDTTSVPLPFECVFAVEVEDPQKAERLLHQTFHDQRTRSTREFFEVGPQRVIAAMQLTGGKDVTPTAITMEDEESQRAVDKAKTRRANFNFGMVGIMPGTELYFWDDPETTCVVHSRNRVIFEERETSVSAAAGDVLERRGMSRNVAGTVYWYFEGESLYERRTRMESDE
jgi:hypothetical protein